jgi:hypothetical protein
MAAKRRRLKLPRRGSHLKTGKGWRLVSGPKRTRTFKAALLTTYYSAGERFAVFRIAR